MSGIYISGLEMPDKQVYVILNPNGLVEVLDANNVLLEEYQAIPIPDHGDLIARDDLLAAYDAEHVGPPGRARELMIEAITIIPASKEVENV